MGMWPFRRTKSRRKKNSAPISPSANEMMQHAAAIERHGGNETTPAADMSNFKGVRGPKRSSREPKKLQRDSERRTYSFSPGRHDTIRVPQDIYRQHPVPPLPISDHAQTWNPALEKGNTGHAAAEWDRVPTLHKRAAQDLPRRKSSKKRKEDHDREAEIKAMSATMPTRPATYDALSGWPLKRGSKRMRDGLNPNFANPSSEISLPSPESLHSSTSSNPDRHASYQLKGMLSPRPTLKFSESPRYGPGASFSGAAAPFEGKPSPQRSIIHRDAMPHNAMLVKKRVDDLADDLTAHDLRELLERDQRRKDKQKLLDQQMMERKLSRRAEKMRAAEAAASRNGEAPPRNMDRGVLGRELLGLGIEAEAEPSGKRRRSAASSRRHSDSATDIGRVDSNESQDPFVDYHRGESPPAAEAGSQKGELEEEPIIATAKVARLSRASLSASSSPKGHSRGASSISQMMDLNQSAPTVHIPPVPAMPERVATRRVSSDASLQQSSWTSWFKRSSRTKRSSIPSSFSNTSRESAIAAAHTGPRPMQSYEIQRSTSNIPKRTMSKFREDLPDFPISPPDSRVQSPEADNVPPIRIAYPEKMDAVSRRHDTPTSGYRSLDAASRLRNETPTSGHRTMDVPSPDLAVMMSQSLASVDSEGSWLSGKPPRMDSKRGSAQTQPHPLRNSASSLERRYRELSESAEELGIAEDEYFSRLTPGADEMFDKTLERRRASGNPMPSSDEEDGDSFLDPGSASTKWGAVARQPTVIHHQPRAKSREVLLTEYGTNFDDDSPAVSPTSIGGGSLDVEDENKSLAQEIKRATSISLSEHHVRHVSAGSAKLLDVKPRASGDAKRLSSESSSN